MSSLEKLRRLGFDLSTHIPFMFTKTWRIRCSQCAAVVINGIPAHERGCPNARNLRQEERR